VALALERHRHSEAMGNVYVDTYTPGDLFSESMFVDGKAAKGHTKLVPSRPLALVRNAIRPLGRQRIPDHRGAAGRLDRMRIQGDGAVIETLKDGYVVPNGRHGDRPTNRLGSARGQLCVWVLRSGQEGSVAERAVSHLLPSQLANSLTVGGLPRGLCFSV